MGSRNSHAQYRRTLDKARADLAEFETKAVELNANIDNARIIVDALESLLGLRAAKNTPAHTTPQQNT